MWIKPIRPEDAQGRLADLYKRVSGPDGQVDNILQAHSLRPHTLEGHMALYKAALHHPRNRLPKTLLESIGIQVSLINGCHYCVVHHYEGLKRLMPDPDLAEQRLTVMMAGRLEDSFDASECAALRYAAKLTSAPSDMSEADIEALRAAGHDDGAIVEINQVAAYFAYANRTVLGLGVSEKGEALGLSPAGDDWEHG